MFSKTSGIACALIGFVLLTLGLSPGLSLFFGDGGSGPPIEIVLPTGFTGPITLVLDEGNGVDIPLIDGRYFLEVPATGLVRVKSFAPFQQWHQEKFVYANGTHIPSASSSNSEPAMIQKRVTTNGTSNGVINMSTFVGTDEQYAEFLRGPRPNLH
jgi:hypothetical protein